MGAGPLLRVGGWDSQMCNLANDCHGYGRYSLCLAEPARMPLTRKCYSAKKAKTIWAVVAILRYLTQWPKLTNFFFMSTELKLNDLINRSLFCPGASSAVLVSQYFVMTPAWTCEWVEKMRQTGKPE